MGVFWQDAVTNGVWFYFLNQGLMLRFMSGRSPDTGRKAAVWLILVFQVVAVIAVANAGWVGRAMVSHGLLPEGSPPEWKRLSLRVVRIKAPDGSESFFMTTLRRAEFSRPQLRELYHLRWEAEEFFKLFKGPYVGQGQFRSRSALGIEQEIHALVLFLQIARLLMATAADVTETDYRALSQKSAALGLAARARGKRVLLAEIRAPRRLPSLLGKTVNSDGPLELEPGLSWINFTAEAALETYAMRLLKLRVPSGEMHRE